MRRGSEGRDIRNSEEVAKNTPIVNTNGEAVKEWGGGGGVKEVSLNILVGQGSSNVL